jgi:ABC-type phosphate/phosphonate transport system substrate-binding protein
LVQRVDVSATASASLEDVEGSEAGENESEELRGASETAPRPIGTKQAKRRKLDVSRDSKLAEAVSSIAKSQLKRLEESKRRNNIALIQSEDVPEDMRKAFFRAMAKQLLDESGVEHSTHSVTTQSEDDA